ncbi:MAG TPA: hypothetical protein VF144_12715 [Chitinophagaceae bacterium]
MKKVMSKNKVIIVALMAIFSTSFGIPGSAMEKKSDPPGIQIRYLGFVQKNPVFEIVTNNAQVDKFIISIRDEAGLILYSEKLSGKNFSRKYRIDTEEEIVVGGLRFEVRSVNNKKTEVYVVGVTENVTREVALVKVQ